MSDLERFMSRVKRDPVSGCLLWTRNTFWDGYGRFAAGGKDWRAHRWIFLKKFGYLPEVVRHRCDTPACVDWINCLLPGTKADNEADKLARGRQARGERHGNHRLTDAQVVDIRTEYARGVLTYKMLGEVYGVSEAHVCHLVKSTRRPVA